MNRRAGRSIDDLFVVLVGMIGALGGGYWLGLVASVLATGDGRLLDWAAGLICAVLLALIARMTLHHGGLKTCCAFCVLTILAAFVLPAVSYV